MQTPALDRAWEYSFAPIAAPLATFLLVLSACDTGPLVEPMNNWQVQATPVSHSFTALGQTLKFDAHLLDGSGTPMSDVTFEWTSTDTNVATVTSKGLVTAAAVGSATVIVAAVGYAASDTIAITVEQVHGEGTAWFFDGFETGNTASTENGFSWNGGKVSSARPRTGGYAMDLSYQASTSPGANVNNEQRFDLGTQAAAVWIERWIYVGGNYSHVEHDEGSNNKFMALWGRSYSGDNRVKIIVELRPDGDGDSKMRFMVNPSGGPTAFNVGSTPVGGGGTYVSKAVAGGGDALRRGRYTRFRYHVNAGSGPGQGVIKAWIGDKLVFHETGLNIYPTGGSDTPFAPYFEAGYLWGAANSGFEEATAIYEDDIAFYTSDPGW